MTGKHLICLLFLIYLIMTDVFIKDYNQNVWRIIFTQFEGTSTGNIEFNMKVFPQLLLMYPKYSKFLNIYPNPSNSQDITLIYEIAEKEGN